MLWFVSATFCVVNITKCKRISFFLFCSGTIERLDPFTGHTVTGSPSRLCKSELYESWARIMAAVKSDGYKPIWTCSEAKQSEVVYQQTLHSFYMHMHENGLGMWQRKEPQVDSFQLAFFDE